MITLSNKATYKRPAVQAFFLLLVFAALAAFDWSGRIFVYSFFFLLVVFSFFARKAVRELILDGQRLDLTYAQWGRNHMVTYDTRKVVLKIITDYRGPARSSTECLGIYDENQRLLFRVRPIEGYEMKNLQAIVDAAAVSNATSGADAAKS
jgi:hypothetical protein